MPVSRNALIRYKTIDTCLRNRFRKWTLEDLVDACSDALYEYEIDVNYNSGRVQNFEKDLRDNVDMNQNINNTISMTEEEARSIALQRVGKTSSEVTFTRVRIDRENGITVYDVYFFDAEKSMNLVFL